MRITQIRWVVYSLSIVVLLVLLFVMLTERETTADERVGFSNGGGPLTTLRRDELRQAEVSTRPDVDYSASDTITVPPPQDKQDLPTERTSDAPGVQVNEAARGNVPSTTAVPVALTVSENALIQTRSEFRPNASQIQQSIVPVRETTVNSIEETQKLRKQRLQDYCKKHNKGGISNKGDYYHLIVDEKHKIIYCYTPKVGCTQWFKIMGKLKGLPDKIINPDPKLRRDSPEHDKIHDRGLFRFLGSYPIEEAHRMLEEYTTFFFIREPFERLLSAYRDKFNLTWWPGAFYRGIASGIMRKVRPGATKEALSSGLGLTFEEFTRYIADRGAGGWDHHWGLYDDICRPCKINYDFIGHFEDMEQEGPYVLKKAGVDHLVSGNFKPSKTSSRLIKYYSEIPKSRISQLYDRMRSNFEMFGYEYPGPLKDLVSN